jgi:hypothetical protein
MPGRRSSKAKSAGPLAVDPFVAFAPFGFAGVCARAKLAEASIIIAVKMEANLFIVQDYKLRVRSRSR